MGALLAVSWTCDTTSLTRTSRPYFNWISVTGFALVAQSLRSLDNALSIGNRSGESGRPSAIHSRHVVRNASWHARPVIGAIGARSGLFLAAS